MRRHAQPVAVAHRSTPPTTGSGRHAELLRLASNVGNRAFGEYVARQQLMTPAPIPASFAPPVPASFPPIAGEAGFSANAFAGELGLAEAATLGEGAVVAGGTALGEGAVVGGTGLAVTGGSVVAEGAIVAGGTAVAEGTVIAGGTAVAAEGAAVVGGAAAGTGAGAGAGAATVLGGPVVWAIVGVIVVGGVIYWLATERQAPGAPGGGPAVDPGTSPPVSAPGTGPPVTVTDPGTHPPMSLPGAPQAGPVLASGHPDDRAGNVERLENLERAGEYTGNDPVGLRQRLMSDDAAVRERAEGELRALEAAAYGDRPSESDTDEGGEEDERDDLPRHQRISDGNKQELENSGWLRQRLPDEEDRRDFMEWLQRGHEQGEAHEHLRPGSPEAEHALQEWEAEERPGRVPSR